MTGRPARPPDEPGRDSTPSTTAGFWRLADLTLEAGFSGKTLDEATDRGELFRHLGYWSDGRAVTRPIVGDDLSAIPRVFPTNGLRLIKLGAKDTLTSSATVVK